MVHHVIIGNGIAGVTAARTIRKRDSECAITIISSETKYFYSRTALMYIYMGHMKYEHTKPYEDHFWEKNRINLVQDRVESIDFSQKSLKLTSGDNLGYDKLLLATGSVTNKFGWKGQELDGVQGLYSYQDLELLEENTHGPHEKHKKVKTAIIIGGGLIGVELAEMLHTRGIHVIFLIRENRFWGNVLPKEEGALVQRHLEKRGVELRFNTELEEILGDENGRVKAVMTKNGETIECELVGLTTGVRPNIDFLKELSIEIDRGILVDNKLQTSVEDLYAAGDCAQLRTPLSGRKAIEQVWYTGKMMGEVAGFNMSSANIDYKPGYWFNSAKFFDLEYQTYGTVSSELDESDEAFYWQAKGEEKAIKIVFSKNDRRFKGINTFGIRMRHEVFDRWLRSNESVEHVLTHLRDAAFDPEFYRDYVPEITRKFNGDFATNLKSKKRSWTRILS